MLPLDPKKMEMMMKQLGIKIDTLEGIEEVILKAEDKEVVIVPKDIKMINARDVKTLQIVIKTIEEKPLFSIEEEDINILMQKSNLSYEDAKKLLEKHKGDLAKALIEINKN